MSRSQRLRQVAGAATALGVAVAVNGAYAALSTTSEPAPVEVVSGEFSIAVSADQPGTLTMSYANRAAGDRGVQFLTVRNVGDVAVGSLTFDVSQVQSSVLVTGEHGLRLTLDGCPGGWSGQQCPAGAKPAVPATAVRGLTTPVDLSLPLQPAEQRRLRLTVALPSAATNEYQNQSADVVFRFVATQVSEGSDG
jgi:hypothetical protein